MDNGVWSEVWETQSSDGHIGQNCLTVPSSKCQPNYLTYLQ